jgi:hypothetical protein
MDMEKRLEKTEEEKKAEVLCKVQTEKFMDKVTEWSKNVTKEFNALKDTVKQQGRDFNSLKESIYNYERGRIKGYEEGFLEGHRNLVRKVEALACKDAGVSREDLIKKGLMPWWWSVALVQYTFDVPPKPEPDHVDKLPAIIIEPVAHENLEDYDLTGFMTLPIRTKNEDPIVKKETFFGNNIRDAIDILGHKDQ